MLRSLYIRDYALIEELEVEFDGGLNIITGETGAGKSIVIGALKMILGERASTEVVRSGARKAIIEGVFDEADIASITGLLEENQIDVGPQIILRREITSGQSRAFVNDTPATVQLLRRVASYLIDLHGQHEHQSLLHTDTHLPTIDQVGDVESLRSEYDAVYREVNSLVRERQDLARRERELSQQRDLIRFQIDEIDRVDPQSNEEERLDDERRVLENAETLFQATGALYELLFAVDASAHDALVEARNELESLVRIDRTFEESLREIRSAETIVAELARTLQDYNSRIEFNPERLEEIRGRSMALEALKRKYGGTLDAVLEHRKEIGETFALASDFEGAIARLDERIEEGRRRLTRAAVRLSARRKEVAAEIEDAIVRELAHLGMADSRFEARFSVQAQSDGLIDTESGRIAARSDGMDDVEFFIATNVGEQPKPLARIASGGEISRIMLALKTILARSERLPILVFDEIDTGISGAMAGKVGRKMHELSRSHQIIAITHLPQIAALGDIHFRVSKSVADGRTRTDMARLDKSEHADQLASLIAGGVVTDAALESARELMRTGR